MLCHKKITSIGVTLFIIVYLLLGSMSVFAEADVQTETFGPGSITETIATYGDNEEFTLTANPYQDSYFKGWVFLEGYFEYEQDIYDEHTIYIFDPSDRLVIMAVFGADNSILSDNVLYSAKSITVKLSEVLAEITDKEYMLKCDFKGLNVKTNENIVSTELVFTHDILPYPGKYPASFSSQSIQGNSSVNVDVEVIDDIPPVLEAKMQMTVNVGIDTVASFTELFDVTAVDGVDGDITKFITYDVAIGSIDFNIPGLYVVAAQIEDAAGNSARKELTLIVSEADTDSSDPDSVNNDKNNGNDNNSNNENNSDNSDKNDDNNNNENYTGSNDNINNHHYKHNYPKTDDKGFLGSIIMLIISLAVITVTLRVKRKQPI